MSSKYTVTPADLAKASQSVQQTVQDINQQMSSLESAVAPLGSSWQGQAYQAFQQLMERFQNDGKKLTQALQAIGEAIDQNNKNYTQVEESNKTSITGLLSSLG